MAVINQSLGDYLGRENPTLVCDACPRGASTGSRSIAYLIPDHIEDWTDFEYESLCSIYGGTLDRMLKTEFLCQDFSAIPQRPFREIHDERSLESLLTKWNHSVVCEALSKAQNCLYIENSHKTIYMARGGQGRIPRIGKERRYPDWAGIQPGLGHVDVNSISTESINILPGDTKLSTKWLSDSIIKGPVDAEYSPANWLRPLRQIYTYCVRANARYGYIITDKELVVVRIVPSRSEKSPNSTQESSQSLDGSQGLSDNALHGFSQSSCEFDEGNEHISSDVMLDEVTGRGGMLEFKAIPWVDSKQGQSQQAHGPLTVNLALWWLHIMASVSRIIKNRYPPLSQIPAPRSFSTPDPDPRPTVAVHGTGLKMPNRSRKRSPSLPPNGYAAPHDPESSKSAELRGSPKRPKRAPKNRLK